MYYGFLEALFYRLGTNFYIIPPRIFHKLQSDVNNLVDIGKIKLTTDMTVHFKGLCILFIFKVGKVHRNAFKISIDLTSFLKPKSMLMPSGWKS